MKIKKIEKNADKEQMKDAIKFLKKFKSLSFKQQNEIIKKLEKRLDNDICTRSW